MGFRRLAWIACVVLVVACGDDGESSAEPPDPDDQITIVDPDAVTIHAVIGEPAPPCDEVAVAADQLVVADPSLGATGGCLLLGPAVVDASSIEHAELARLVDDLVDIDVELDAEGAQALDQLAASLYPTQGRAAILLDGRFLTAPTIVEPTLGSSVLLSAVPVDEAVELVAALGGDDTLPAPSPDTDELDRARAACEAAAPQGRAPLAVTPTTAGSITAELGDDAIEPWRSLPPDHFVARCGYGPVPTDTPRTTLCPDGETVSLAAPDERLVDEEGRATPDPASIRGPVSPC